MCGAGSPSSHLLGAPPHTPGDFLMRRKSPKTHQEPPGPWTPGEGGLAPFDPPASALAVLVEGKKVCGILGGGAAERAADSLSPLSSKKTAVSSVGCTGRTWQSGPIRGQELFPDEGDGNREWEQGNKHLFLLYIHFYIYLL